MSLATDLIFAQLCAHYDVLSQTTATMTKTQTNKQANKKTIQDRQDYTTDFLFLF
jgi:hypothetical protein